MKRIAKLILMTLLAATILAGCGSVEFNTTPSYIYVRFGHEETVGHSPPFL